MSPKALATDFEFDLELGPTSDAQNNSALRLGSSTPRAQDAERPVGGSARHQKPGLQGSGSATKRRIPNVVQAPHQEKCTQDERESHKSSVRIGLISHCAFIVN